MSFTNDSVSGALPEQMNATPPKDFQGLTCQVDLS